MNNNFCRKINLFKPRTKKNFDIEPSAPPYYEKILVKLMKSDQSYCLGGRQYSRTVNQIVYEKLNPETQKLVKNIKRECDI